MKKTKVFKEFYKVFKTDYEDILVLPWGNSNREEVSSWIRELSQEDFEELMRAPIIVQAKIFYTKLRES